MEISSIGMKEAASMARAETCCKYFVTMKTCGYRQIVLIHPFSSCQYGLEETRGPRCHVQNLPIQYRMRGRHAVVIADDTRHHLLNLFRSLIDQRLTHLFPAETQCMRLKFFRTKDSFSVLRVPLAVFENLRSSGGFLLPHDHSEKNFLETLEHSRSVSQSPSCKQNVAVRRMPC